jgi:hypothetical protein
LRASFDPSAPDSEANFAYCLGLALLNLRDQWVLFGREKLSPRPYNQAGRLIGVARMIVGLTMLAVLTIIAIVEVWKTPGMQLENED